MRNTFLNLLVSSFCSRLVSLFSVLHLNLKHFSPIFFYFTSPQNVISPAISPSHNQSFIQCHFVTMSLSHNVTFPQCHVLTILPSRLLTMSLSPQCRLPTMSLSYNIIFLHCHFQRRHFLTVSLSHSITFLKVTFSQCYLPTMSLSHTVTFSQCNFPKM